MAEYIEREALREVVNNLRWGKHLNKDAALNLVERAIDNLPTADVVPVVHGRWVMVGGRFRCSECDSKALWELESNVGGCREYAQVRSNLCHNCGATMDLEVSE